MKYFTLNELTHSTTAKNRGIKNIPTDEAKESLVLLIEKLLDPIREKWGRAIKVNSGYRNIEVNTLAGGTKNSQHIKGEAADITSGSKEENKALFELIKSNGLDFDQLIDEKNYQWLHVSFKKTGNRKQVLHL